MVLVSHFSVGKGIIALSNFTRLQCWKVYESCKVINHTGDCLILKVKTKLHEVLRCCSCCLEKSEGDWITNPNVEGFSYILTGKTGHYVTAKNIWEYTERNTVLKIHSLNWCRLGSVLTQQGIGFLVTFHQKAEPKLAQLWIFIKKKEAAKTGARKFSLCKMNLQTDYFSNWISLLFDGNKNKTFSVFSRFAPASSQSI